MIELTTISDVKERIASGPLQFGEDWPGIFIRGDDAIAKANLIRLLAKSLKMELVPINRIVNYLEIIADELSACDIGN